MPDENQQIQEDPISEETQQELNTPVSDPTGLSDKNQEFLNLVVSMMNDGKIQPYSPSSLINEAVYNGLTEEHKGKVDLEAINMLGALRQIKDLHDAGFTDTYQIKNMVDTARNTKERLEEEGGDIFII